MRIWSYDRKKDGSDITSMACLCIDLADGHEGVGTFADFSGGEISPRRDGGPTGPCGSAGKGGGLTIDNNEEELRKLQEKAKALPRAGKAA
ncbi:MAG: hypothetical protein M1377_06585 [Deltaproteobacteria bacterium]|nr:hypothetical protein [Deltaproteobacteria bacterium]